MFTRWYHAVPSIYSDRPAMTCYESGLKDEFPLKTDDFHSRTVNLPEAKPNAINLRVDTPYLLPRMLYEAFYRENWL